MTCLNKLLPDKSDFVAVIAAFTDVLFDVLIDAFIVALVDVLIDE